MWYIWRHDSVSIPYHIPIQINMANWGAEVTALVCWHKTKRASRPPNGHIQPIPSQPYYTVLPLQSASSQRLFSQSFYQKPAFPQWIGGRFFFFCGKSCPTPRKQIHTLSIVSQGKPTKSDKSIFVDIFLPWNKDGLALNLWEIAQSYSMEWFHQRLHTFSVGWKHTHTLIWTGLTAK